MDTINAKIRKVSLDQPFALKGMERIELDHAGMDRVPHRHDHFVIILATEAHGTHQIDFVDYPLENNTLHLLTPDQVHQLVPEGMPDGYVLTFQPDFLYQYCMSPEAFLGLDLFFNCNEVPPMHLRSEHLEQVTTLIELIKHEMRSQKSGHFAVVGALLKALLLIAKRIKSEAGHASNGQHSRQNEIVFHFRKDLEQHFRTIHKVNQFADRQHLTSNYLNEVVKKQTGHSAKDMIQQRIILEAKRLAVYSSMSMKEIAWHLGFEDIAHFSKFFKRLQGINFKDFRNSNP
ncbi:MAG: helix-turn-helix transcriptional regulator [Bacteroidota bacterium]